MTVQIEKMFHASFKQVGATSNYLERRTIWCTVVSIISDNDYEGNQSDSILPLLLFFYHRHQLLAYGFQFFIF